MPNVWGSFEYGEATYTDFIRVGWSAPNMNRRAQIWRVLDLSGMTKSVRESRNFTRAGYVFLDASRVSSLRTTVELGRLFVLELRFPNGVTKSQNIMLVPQNRTNVLKPRVQEPDPAERFHKG
jgi:hypothetical protein